MSSLKKSSGCRAGEGPAFLSLNKVLNKKEKRSSRLPEGVSVTSCLFLNTSEEIMDRDCATQQVLPVTNMEQSVTTSKNNKTTEGRAQKSESGHGEDDNRQGLCIKKKKKWIFHSRSRRSNITLTSRRITTHKELISSSPEHDEYAETGRVWDQLVVWGTVKERIRLMSGILTSAHAQEAKRGARFKNSSPSSRPSYKQNCTFSVWIPEK